MRPVSSPRMGEVPANGRRGDLLGREAVISVARDGLGRIAPRDVPNEGVRQIFLRGAFVHRISLPQAFTRNFPPEKPHVLFLNCRANGDGWNLVQKKNQRKPSKQEQRT